MIRLNAVSIEKFRGIRKIHIDFKGSSFGICGPNGTGKSGIVDAIEFALTGNVSRLTGPGRGDLSVRDHAPHVKEYGNPKEARVSLSVFIPSIKQQTTITRSVDKPKLVMLDPDTPEIRSVISEVQLHPEFALSRREVIRYIIAEPNKRSTDVQELLRLSDIEDARRALTRIANDERKSRDGKEQLLLRARNDLMQTLGIKFAGSLPVMNAVNEQRAILKLPALAKLEAGTSFKAGIPTDSGAAAKDATPRPVSKEQALRDAQALKQWHENGSNPENTRKRASATEDLQKLLEDTAALRRLQQRTLVQTGIRLLDGNNCPLCDKSWNHDDLREYLSEKLRDAQQTSIVLARVQTNLNAVIAELDTYAATLGRIIQTCGRLQPAISAKDLVEHQQAVVTEIDALREFVSNSVSLESARKGLAFQWNALSPDALKQLDACIVAASKIAGASDEEKARDLLTLATDKYAVSVSARADFKRADERSQMASKALAIYEEQKDASLGALYLKVADDFTNFYRSINPEDEGEFVGKLVPSAAKLGFDVDFYGYGKFPPGAYHSEGHQDGMGLCLYLALMKHTLGENFTFSVLDDVLMSIDTDHRRNVCKLLVRAFPNTQFILTTHDRVWLKFMQTEGLIKRSQTFSAWTVEAGPRVSEHEDTWQKIESALESGDVNNAASLLRHHLEFISEILADSLKAKVQYKGDGQYTLEDLMPPVLARWKEKLAEAVKAAKSWDNEGEMKRISTVFDQAADAIRRIEAERWALNPNVHYNKWNTFSDKEFRPVVKAFYDLLSTMQCKKCAGYIELVPRHSSAEIMKCNCGGALFNLVRKPN